MVVDSFLFFNELDLLEIRLNVLDKYVDKFVLVESFETFSGKPKPFYYEENKERFKKWEHKIVHHKVTGYSDEAWQEAKASPQTGGLEHWCREYMQREEIKKALAFCQDEDIIFMGDVDEIWHPMMVSIIPKEMRKLMLDVYSYFLNNKSSEVFHGTVIGYFKDIKSISLNSLRATTKKSVIPGGWHFTSMGGVAKVKEKIESYGHQEFNTDEIKSKLESRIENGQDYIGRGFTFSLDESQLPEYLKENKGKYKHLWK